MCFHCFTNHFPRHLRKRMTKPQGHPHENITWRLNDPRVYTTSYLVHLYHTHECLHKRPNWLEWYIPDCYAFAGSLKLNYVKSHHGWFAFPPMLVSNVFIAPLANMEEPYMYIYILYISVVRTMHWSWQSYLAWCWGHVGKFSFLSPLSVVWEVIVKHIPSQLPKGYCRHMLQSRLMFIVFCRRYDWQMLKYNVKTGAWWRAWF